MTFTPLTVSRDMSVYTQTTAPAAYSQNQLGLRSQWHWRVFRLERRPSRPDGRTLREPSRDARHGFAHVLGRTRVGKTDVAVSVHRIEVDAGRCSDMSLVQHLVG